MYETERRERVLARHEGDWLHFYGIRSTPVLSLSTTPFTGTWTALGGASLRLRTQGDRERERASMCDARDPEADDDVDWPSRDENSVLIMHGIRRPSAGDVPIRGLIVSQDPNVLPDSSFFVQLVRNRGFT